MAKSSRLSIQNINSWRLWIRKNKLFNLINQQPDIDQVYLHVKDLNEAKYQFLIRKGEDVGTKHFNGSKTFIECSNDMEHIYKNIEKYNPNKKQNINHFW